jgi:hypothetical protein
MFYCGLWPTLNYGILTAGDNFTESMPSRKATPLPSLLASAQRFRQAQQELQQLNYFFKGTVLKRMMKCGQPQCACHRDPSRRHGPYFEWTYKANGKTVNVKLSPQAAPLYLVSVAKRLEGPYCGPSVYTPRLVNGCGGCVTAQSRREKSSRKVRGGRNRHRWRATNTRHQRHIGYQ